MLKPDRFSVCFVGLSIFLLTSFLSGCEITRSEHNEQVKQEKVALTTFTVLADMAKNVAGNGIKIESITKTGAEIHGYEFTPSDLTRGQRASLIMENGFNLESWMDRFYNSLPKVAKVTLSKGITPIGIASDEYQGKPNPHAWMSPQNALIYVENIKNALTEVDPQNSNLYITNANKYREQIQAIDKKLRDAIATIPPDRRFIVTCEGAFSYLARDYGLKEVYIWPVNAEQQATPRRIEAVINTVKQNQVPAIFCESTVNNKAQLQIAKATGAKFGGVFYVDSLSEADGPASTYLKLLEHNVNTLVKGLTE